MGELSLGNQYRSLRNYFNDWSRYEMSWLFIFTLVNIGLFIAWEDTWIGLTASISGMLCVVLTAKGKISSFYWGLLNILAYAYVAFQSAYYGDVALNILYFLPMAFIGIYYWNKNSIKKQTSRTVLVRSLSWREKIIWFAVSLLSLYLLGTVLKMIKGTLPFVDATTTVFSVIATILLTKRYSDQWFYWILVDIWSIVMWVYIFIRDGNQISMLVMWSAFLVNAIYGYVSWRKLEAEQRTKRSR